MPREWRTPFSRGFVRMAAMHRAQLFVREFRNEEARRTMKKLNFEASYGGESTPIYFQMFEERT